jgi:hypothetical protein
MTFSDLLDIGKACLVEYEPRLKVMGKKPYSQSANASLCVSHDCSLSEVTKEEVEQQITMVLDGLVALKDGFVMSEPRSEKAAGSREEEIVSHKDVSLTFVYGYNITKHPSTYVLWIRCWYYPVG